MTIRVKAKWLALVGLILGIGLISTSAMKPIQDNSRWVSRCLIKNHGELRYFTMPSYRRIFIYCYGFGIYDEVTVGDWIEFVKYRVGEWAYVE